MNWNNILDLVVIGLLLNGAVGSLLFLLWMSLNYCLKERMDVQLSYQLLHVIQVFFLLPFFGIYEVYVSSAYTYGNMVHDALVPDGIDLWIIICGIWGIGTLIWLIIYAWLGIRAKRAVRMGSMSSNRAWQSSVDQAAQFLNYSKKVDCRQKYGIDSPFVSGCIQSTIYVPVTDYSEEYRFVMALHELNHLRSGDLLWKIVSTIVCVIYWPLAPVWILRRKVEDWSEYSCDFMSCQLLDNYKRYYDVLTGTVADRYVKDAVPWIAGFAGERSEVRLRILSLIHQQKLTKVRRRVITAAASLFVICGCSVVMASTAAVTYEYQTIYWDELDKEIVDKNSMIDGHPIFDTGMDDYDPKAEYRIPVDHLELDHIPRETWLDGTIPGYDQALDPFCMFYEVDLEYGETAVSYPFDNTRAGDIYMTCALDSEEASFLLGIVTPDGQAICYPVDHRQEQGYTFHCSQTGKYRFFIRNQQPGRLDCFGLVSVVQ